MKRQWALIVLAAILFGVTPPSSNAAQKRGRSAATSRRSRTSELGSVEQFKVSFQNNAGKVRLVALVSPT
jgi:hypothetical protein